MIYQLEISDITIDVVWKKIKNIHLSVYPPTGRVRLAAPLSTTEETLRLFAISKLGWIRRNQRQLEAQARQSPRTFVDRESHYFEGRRYLLRVTEHEGSPKIEIKTKTHIDLFVRPNTSVEQRQRILNEWYRKHLKAQIPALVAKWEDLLGVTVDEWGIKQMKTKWGTCNIEEKRIWLNLELAKKPLHCLEYIVVHEMVHLLERYHNDRFRYYMDRFMPKWKVYKEELNQLPVSYSEWAGNE